MKIYKKDSVAGGQNIIWAKNTGKLLYEGSPVCHDFGNQHFYYSSCVVNCVFDCDYCFLKGKYDNRDIIVYQNLKDYFREVELLLSRLNKDEQLYLCVSFDTDLFPLEQKIHYVEKWSEFAELHNQLKVEVRTKASKTSRDFWDKVSNQNMIFAFSLSPQEIIERFEHKAAPLKARLASISAAIKADANVRLCIDPIIYVKNWEENYTDLVDEIFRAIKPSQIKDVAIGSFRISQSYLKKMRQRYPENPLALFPYDLVEGYYQYPLNLQNVIESKIKLLLIEHVGDDKIFGWSNTNLDKLNKFSPMILPSKYKKNDTCDDTGIAHVFETYKPITHKSEDAKSRKFNNDIINIIDKVAELLRCSHTQKIQLEQLLNFAKVADIDIHPIYKYVKDNYTLPPKSKNETSKILSDIKNYLISSF